MNPLLGIDFGTTNTAAALVVGREIKVVPLAGGALSIPSVVSFPPSTGGGRPLVGAAAVAAARLPERTITGVKRLLGRKLEAPEVRHQRQEVPYELVMAKKLEATEEEIIHAMHPHPTFSEAVMEAAGQAVGESVHI